MRNWNPQITNLTIELEGSFYSTYEELKPQRNIEYILNSNLFLQYLWGIETSISRFRYHVNTFVFTVPMRNWNFLLFFSLFPIQAGFYSTYEELKLRTLLMGTKEKMCFYSTYEELKQSNAYNFNCYCYGFYSTYEELKLAFRKGWSWLKSRFYSTYEELKLVTCLLLLQKYICFYSTYEELKQVENINNLPPDVQFL